MHNNKSSQDRVVDPYQLLEEDPAVQALLPELQAMTSDELADQALALIESRLPDSLVNGRLNAIALILHKRSLS